VNGRLGCRQIELDQLLAHFFHGYTLGFVRLRVGLVVWLIKPRASASPELLGSQRGDIDE
jgi:hypothetical protein